MTEVKQRSLLLLQLFLRPVGVLHIGILQVGDELLLVGVNILPVQGGPLGLLFGRQPLGTLSLLGQLVDPGDLFCFPGLFLLMIHPPEGFPHSPAVLWIKI